MLTYLIINGGFQILLDGLLWIDQPFDPSQSGFVPYATDADAEYAALEFIAEQVAAASAPPPVIYEPPAE